MRTRTSLVLLLVFCFAAAIPAANDENKVPEKKDRKSKGLFSRPTRPSADAQFQYARQLLSEGKQRRAGRAFDALVRAWPDAPEAPKAQMAYAQTLEQRRKYTDAFDEYQYLVDHYAGLFTYADVMTTQFQIAEQVKSMRHGSFGIFRGFTAPERALPLFEQLVKNAPNWEKAPEAQFNIGWIHEQNGDYELAVTAYETASYLYPRSPFAAKAAFEQSVCAYRIAERAPNDVSAAQEARSCLAQFIRKYPNDANTTAARENLSRLNERQARQLFSQAEYYDKTLKKPDAALIAYKDFLSQFPLSDLAPKARNRMQELKSIAENHHEK